MNNLLNNINGWIANGPYGNDLMATSYSSGAVAAGDAAAESYASDTEHAIFIPEIWADAIDAAFKKKLILGDLATDYSGLLAGGGDTIRIPTVAEVKAAASKSVHTPVSYANNTEEQIPSIVVNEHYYASAMVEDMAKVQAKYDVMSKYAESMAYRLAEQIESALLTKLNSTTNGIVLAPATSKKLKKAEFATMTKTLLTNNINPSDCVVVLGNAYYSSLFENDDFIHVSKVDNVNFPQGTVGQFMGMTVVHSPSITGTLEAGGGDGAALDTNAAGDEVAGGYVVHRDSVAIAYSKRPTPVAEYDMDYIAHKMVTDMIYGCGLVQDANQKKVFTLYEEGVTNLS